MGATALQDPRLPEEDEDAVIIDTKRTVQENTRFSLRQGGQKTPE